MKAEIVEGRAIVTEDAGKLDSQGQPQTRVWDMRADHVAAHLPQFADLSAGDRSMLRDVANEAAKRKARGE